MAVERSEKTVAEEVSRLVDSAKELQDSAGALISRNSGEEDALRQRAFSLDSTIRGLRKSVSSLVESGDLDRKEAEKLVEELYRASYILSEGDAAAFLPSKSHGRFLSMFLGPINVRATRKDVKLKVKEEYNSFRDRTTYLFLFFPSLLLVLRSWIWDGCLPALPVQLYQAWLLFLYIGLALRENILRVNGSGIRPWSGKAFTFDPVVCCSLGEWTLSGRKLLESKGFEAYVGMLLLKTALVGVVSEWQVITCGILLIIMAVGNFANTVETLVAKSRVKEKMKRSKSRLELNQGSSS
ncbi:TMPIT-like protein [Actinidia rufa]|uniref:TMPIT-like protein n=1 Tax=Actinidia rufa TaxID=165716 RepID=A0A7J0GYU3_9ERIC|nr:TMPIT-like protein [Actinidia rufa]